MKSKFYKLYAAYWQYERANGKANLINILSLRSEFYAGYIEAYVLVNEHINNI